jgi:hypothetical protein
MLPAGFEAVAVAAFRAYIATRFPSNTSARFLGSTAATIVPPSATIRQAVADGTASDTDVARVGVWKLWRGRAYAAAMERFRTRLHPRGISVLANSVFWIQETADPDVLSTQWQSVHSKRVRVYG